MKWDSLVGVGAIPALLACVPVEARDFLDLRQVQEEFFPDSVLTRVALRIEPALRAQLRALSGIREPFNEDGVWRALNGGWLIADSVIGKHETIEFAVALDAQGAVLGVEILRYNESYGGEVRGAAWRAQFLGKTVADQVALGKDIRNISGATLSGKHVTQGVKRILLLHSLLLRNLSP